MGSVREMELFHDYVFLDVLELLDEWRSVEPGHCPVYHVAPRFARRMKGEIAAICYSENI